MGAVIEPLRYRGREIGARELEEIRALIAQHPGDHRRRLSVRLCELWNWRQVNGALRDGVCRSLMLWLHRAGHIQLPPVRRQPPNNAALRRRPSPVGVDTSPRIADLAQIRPIEIRQVRRTDEERLFDGLIQEHHFLGYVRPVGEHVKLMAWAVGRPVACLAWCSAPRHLAPRDRFIGWSAEARRRNIRYVAYSTRYLSLS